MSPAKVSPARAQAAAPAAVALPRVVDLDALEPVRAALLDALARGPVRVEAGAVERIATNALFLLLCAGETARRAETGFTIGAASAAMEAAIARLGLGPAFAPYLEG